MLGVAMDTVRPDLPRRKRLQKSGCILKALQLVLFFQRKKFLRLCRGDMGGLAVSAFCSLAPSPPCCGVLLALRPLLQLNPQKCLQQSPSSSPVSGHHLPSPCPPPGSCGASSPAGLAAAAPFFLSSGAGHRSLDVTTFSLSSFLSLVSFFMGDSKQTQTSPRLGPQLNPNMFAFLPKSPCDAPSRQLFATTSQASLPDREAPSRMPFLHLLCFPSSFCSYQ